MARGPAGHLEQLPSGGFRVDVYAGTDPLTGRRLRYRRVVKTEQQARIVLGKLLGQAAAGAPPDSGVTVAELLARYMEVAELEPSTRETYDGYIRRTILPALGSMPLRKLRGPVLDTFYLVQVHPHPPVALAREHYLRRRDRGDGHPAALRHLFNKMLGQLHHCLRTGQPYDPVRAFPHTHPAHSEPAAA